MKTTDIECEIEWHGESVESGHIGLPKVHLSTSTLSLRMFFMVLLVDHGL